MTEEKGHYEKGRWVVDPAEPAQQPGPEPTAAPSSAAPTIDELAGEASRSVQKAVDDVIRFGHNLLMTPEGHERIEQTVDRTAKELKQAIQDAAEAARRAMQQK